MCGCHITCFGHSVSGCSFGVISYRCDSTRLRHEVWKSHCSANPAFHLILANQIICYSVCVISKNSLHDSAYDRVE